MNFFIFIFYLFLFIFKFNRPIPIVAFRESYSGVLNGTRAPWTRVPFFFFFFFLSLIVPYSNFYKSSSTLKIDFQKIEFLNRGISLISLKNEAKYYIFCAKKTGQFSPFKTHLFKIQHETHILKRRVPYESVNLVDFDVMYFLLKNGPPGSRLIARSTY